METEMRRCGALSVVSAVVCSALLSAAVLTYGCGGPAVEIGPKPAAQPGQTADEGQIVDEMRAWLQSISVDDARKLEEAGRLNFRYQNLKTSDPEHAQIVDRYTKGLEAKLAEGMLAMGTPAPQFDVQRVSFIRQADGAYQLEIRWLPNGGTKVQLSDPL
jgi:hypothetical protein